MSNSTSIGKSHVVALPVTREELLAKRKVFRQRTLNDHVDDIHCVLWENKKYRDFLEAVYDGDTIEGSLTADNFEAAGMIRDYSIEFGIEKVTKTKKASIVKALKVVLRRYGITREERAVTIDNEIVNGNPLTITHE